MRNIRTRIKMLERLLPAKRDTDWWSEISRNSLKHLSLPELEILDRVLTDQKNGEIGRELTKEESDALAASSRAFDLECKRAGFSSVAQLTRLCGRRK